ncbi:MAG: hypothetical protein HWN67_22990 [Candidatus Helarchaeota archaeon]|nr:hypothetical protein [Candidatus Helarchaeota archaeon]
MPKRSKKKSSQSKIEIESVTLDKDEVLKLIKKSEKDPEEKKGIYDEITKELKSTFSLPKFGLKDRKMNVMARIDEGTSKVLDALVALDLVPSRSAAAAYLIAEAIRKDQDKYYKILESFDTIKSAKEKAQYSFYKSLQDTEEEGPEEEIDSEDN